MGFEASWDEGGLDGILDDLKEVSERAGDWRAVLSKEAHDLHNDQMAEIFRTEGAASKHGRWRDLSPGTRRGRSILDQTGRLKRSYSQRGTDHVWRATQLGVVAGSNDPHARFHEQGGAHLPRRSVQKSEKQHAAFDDLVFNWVVGEQK